MQRGETSSRKAITTEKWKKKLCKVKIKRNDMNQLIMNFLVTEGYVAAAEKFKMESGTEPDMDLGKIMDLMVALQAIQVGSIDYAIEEINYWNPELLETNPQLHFHLQQQSFIELIRRGELAEALRIAQENFAPRWATNHAFLEEFERTFALFAFEEPSTCPIGELLDFSRRQQVAKELYSAILISQGCEKDPKLSSVLKLLIWAQGQFDKKAYYPHITDLVNATLEDPVF